MMAVAEHLDRLRSRLGGELDEEVRELERSVEEAIEGLRRLSFDLSLGAQEEDLAGALEARLRRIRTRTGLRYRLEEQIVREPSTTTRLAALRILDEILANVCRHADATGIDVKLLAAEAVEVRVADDGAGFDVARMTAGPERMGLALMRHRAEAAGGSLLVYRSPGDGTVVEFSLPAA